MEITSKYIKVGDIFEDYKDSEETGAIGYGGDLDIRPAYQREFIYEPEAQKAVIQTLVNNFPLGLIYWAKAEKDSPFKYEMLDGQQRTLSILRFLDDVFQVEINGYEYVFSNLSSDAQEKIKDYELEVKICTGTPEERLRWFQTINTVGEPLTIQEMRNAIYNGQFVTEAKRYFSKPNAPGYVKGKDYIRGEYKRQDYMERALQWLCYKQEVSIEEYMSHHSKDSNAQELIHFFEQVISWVSLTFPNPRKEMKGLEWGRFYVDYAKQGDQTFDARQLEEEIAVLMKDSDVTKKSGIYEYVLSGREKENLLNIRAFDENIKREVYEKQKGICIKCGKEFPFEEMQGDHVIPWSKGGKTEASNCQMLCIECNGRKSAN